MNEIKKLPGVVALITYPDGTVLASVADFDGSRYGGFSLEEAQSMRAAREVKWKAVRLLCHHDVPDSLNDYEVEKIADSLVRAKGYRITVVPVNQPNGG